MSYAYSDGVVWLEDLAAEAHPMVHDLCESHASTVRVPRGWELRDQRTTAVAEAAVERHPVGYDQLDLVGA
jgi:hypothetical protein